MLLFFPTQENITPRKNGDKEKHPIQHFLQVIKYTFIFGNCCSYVLHNTLNNKSNGAVFHATDEIIDKEHTLSIFLQISILQKWLGA